jgi:hypothetical protein
MRNLLKHRWLWATVLLVVVVGVGYLVVPVGEGRISQATCDRIRMRMTLGEVLDLLSERGTPRGNWGAILGPVSIWFWSDEDGNEITVSIDDNGVMSKSFAATNLPFREQLSRRIQRRLGALWVKAQRPAS